MGTLEGGSEGARERGSEGGQEGVVVVLERWTSSEAPLARSAGFPPWFTHTRTRTRTHTHITFGQKLRVSAMVPAK